MPSVLLSIDIQEREYLLATALFNPKSSNEPFASLNHDIAAKRADGDTVEPYAKYTVSDTFLLFTLLAPCSDSITGTLLPAITWT